VHLLTIEGYAESVGGEPDFAWVLLGRKPPEAPPAAPAAPPAPLALCAPGTPAEAEAAVPAAAATASRPRKGKGKETALPMAVEKDGSAAGSSSGAGPSGVYPSAVYPSATAGESSGPPKKRQRRADEAEPPSAVPLDISSFSAVQLAELQVRIAQQLGAAK